MQLRSHNHVFSVIFHQRCFFNYSKHGVKVDYIGGDLNKVSDIETMCEEIHKLYPNGIDILMNNAGNHLLKVPQMA